MTDALTIYLMPILKDQGGSPRKAFGEAGVFPLFVLIAIGVAVLAGGTYIIREQFVKTGQSGKSALDNKKIQEQIKNPQTLPSLTPEPSAEKTYGQPVTYKTSGEPSFSISPPSGWDKVTPSISGTKVQFKHPEEDKEEMEDGLFVKSQAQITVFMDKTNTPLDQLVSSVKSASKGSYEKVNILSEQKTTFGGQEAYLFETELFKKGASLHSLDYYFIKDGYAVRVGGTSLGSTWSSRSSDIKNSLNSFKLLE